MHYASNHHLVIPLTEATVTVDLPEGFYRHMRIAWGEGTPSADIFATFDMNGQTVNITGNTSNTPNNGDTRWSSGMYADKGFPITVNCTVPSDRLWLFISYSDLATPLPAEEMELAGRRCVNP